MVSHRPAAAARRVRGVARGDGVGAAAGCGVGAPGTGGCLRGGPNDGGPSAVEAIVGGTAAQWLLLGGDRKSTRLNSSHGYISYAVFCLKKKNNKPGVHLRNGLDYLIMWRPKMAHKFDGLNSAAGQFRALASPEENRAAGRPPVGLALAG